MYYIVFTSRMVVAFFFFCPVLVCVEALDGVSLVHLHRGIHAVSPPPFFKLSFVGPKSKANKIHSHYSPIVFEKEQKAIIWECIEPRYIHGLEGNRRTFWGTDENQCKNVKISIGGFGVVNKRRLPRCRPISLQYTTLMYILFRISNIFFWNFLQREFAGSLSIITRLTHLHILYTSTIALAWALSRMDVYNSNGENQNVYTCGHWSAFISY